MQYGQRSTTAPRSSKEKENQPALEEYIKQGSSNENPIIGGNSLSDVLNNLERPETPVTKTSKSSITLNYFKKLIKKPNFL